MDNESKEFLVFNKPIEKFSILYGFFLLLWGIVISLISGSDSFTSYIPSILGLPIIIGFQFSVYHGCAQSHLVYLDLGRNKRRGM